MFFKKNYKIHSSYGSIEPHEVFLDKMAHTSQIEMGISEKKLEVPLQEKIAYSLFFIFFVFAGILFSKTFFLQAIQGAAYLNISENNKGAIAFIRPERGIIYDRNSKKLVFNSPAYDLICDKRKIESQSSAFDYFNELAISLGKPTTEISALFDVSISPQVLVAENIPQENLLVLETKMNRLTACRIDKNTSREYPLAEIMSPVLGYTGRINEKELGQVSGYALNDYLGKTGIEKSYESYLRGKPGELKANRTALGQEVSNDIVKEPVSGNNIVLNIDADLQTQLYNSLEKSIKSIGSKKGAAVAMDPRTGAVLAMVSYPSYDNNLFSKGISLNDYNKIQNDPDRPLFNRAIAAQYPTGSTIKPFEASGALQEKLISPLKKINDPGYIVVYSQNDPSVSYRFGGVTPHGMVDMREAIAVSSNIYFYTVGGGYGDQQGLGPARIKKYLELFGWGEKTGVDMPGEFSGFIPTPEWKKQTKKEPWWNGDTYNLSIGQSDLMVTPLQVAAAYCAIANNGTLYRPQIVQKVIDTSSGSPSILKEFKPEVIRSNFIDDENLQIVREGMRMAVTKADGSAHYLSSLPVSVASKTGTAEIGVEGHYNTWTSAFAPYDDPEIVITVTIERVSGLRSATLPVAHDVLNWYFSR